MDRIVDYMIVLEAILVPEKDFVGRRLRERAISLLKISKMDMDDTKRLLRDFYKVRSSVVHGSDISAFKDGVLKKIIDFEAVVRSAIISALRTLPRGDEGRKKFLKQLFDICDQTRAEYVFNEFCKIKNEDRKENCFKRISERIYKS